MSKKRNRARDKRDKQYIQNAWKQAVDKGVCFVFRMSQLETDLAKAPLIYDPDDLEVAHLQRRLAMMYHRWGKRKEATELMSKAVQTYDRRLGKDDPVSVAWKAVLGCLYQDIGELEQAVRMLERALYIAERSPHPSYPSVPLLIWNLASAYQDLAPFKAIELYEELLAIEAEKTTPDASKLLRCRIDIARAYRKTGMTAAAIQHLNDTRDSKLAGRSVQHPDQARVAWELALNYRELACYQEALNLIRQVKAVDLQQNGSLHVNIAFLFEIEGDLLLQLGEWDRGLACLEEAYLLFWRICGSESEDTKRVKQRLEELKG